MSSRIKCFLVEFTGDRPYQCRRVDTGEVFESVALAPVGAMWFAEWLDGVYVPQLDHVLVVKTPGGDWVIDMEANNCTMPNRPKSARRGKHETYGRFQEDHHCWIIQGAVPDITVDKNGVTCGAGAGSIGQPHYHGFLRNGYLEEC